MPCTRSDQGGRVLRARHRDDCYDPDTCPGCLPCPDHHCAACRHEHAPTICPSCLLDTRTDLRMVGTLAPNLRVEAVNGRSAYAVRQDVPGGDALVMAGPGASPNVVRPQLGDPIPPLSLLSAWVDTWQHVMHHESMPPVRDLDYAVEYLDRRLHMMADLHTGTYLVMARELATMRRRVEDVTHDGERADTSRVPCWECGARLVKVYAAKVGDDHWCCPRCGEMYDQHRYERALHDHLASNGAARMVYVTDATAAIGRPVQTVRAWIRTGRVETDRDPVTNRLRAWWPDVRSAHLETRHGRGAYPRPSARSPRQD